MQPLVTLILGGGVTGLSAGYASGAPVCEARPDPGGLCASYYSNTGGAGLAYRFEVGGGHWIFGGDPQVTGFLERLSPMRSYERRAAVFFPDRGLLVPFPLQNHLDLLSKAEASQARDEMRQNPPDGIRTMRQWLEAKFGPTLTALFFGPFHEAYTAGLWTEIAPQDGYKTPAVSAQGSAAATYNTCFRYPQHGLDHLARRLAERCDLRCDTAVAGIDAAAREVHFADGTALGYTNLISTLPLNRTMQLCGLRTDEVPDPSTAVMVLNIGARRGPRCPDVHWLYVPRSRSGFFRVGFYSNVDAGFVPGGNPELVGIYVERAFRDGARPSSDAQLEYIAAVTAELQDWGFIAEVEAADANWVEVGYTWMRPGSRWRDTAILTLQQNGVNVVGRYAQWRFQGISDSIRDGLVAGAAFRP